MSMTMDSAPRHNGISWPTVVQGIRLNFSHGHFYRICSKIDNFYKQTRTTRWQYEALSTRYH